MTAPTVNDRLTMLAPAAGTTALVYDFKLDRQDALTVQRIRAGVTVTLVRGVDYSFLSGLGSEAGGTVTLAAASLAGDTYVLIGLLPIVRQSDFVHAAVFDTVKLNADLDYLTRSDQELRRDIERAWKAGYGSVGGVIFVGANGTVAMFQDGNLVEGPSADEIENAQGYAVAAGISADEAAASAAAALAALLALASVILYRDIPALKADAVLTYGSTTPGALILTRSEGSVFKVAASSATDHHLTTAGGVKLYDFGTYDNAATAQTQVLMDRLQHGLSGDVIVVSDSTGVGTDRWVYRIGSLIGADYPTHSVLWREWDDGTSNYGSATVLQTGTGAGVLTFWSASISGSVANRFTGAQMAAAVTPGTIGRDPDLIIFNYGHNGGNALEIQVPMQAAAVGSVSRLCPLTPIIIIGQNPVTSGANTDDGTMRAKVTAWQTIAQEAGAGFIDVHAFFEDYARPYASYMGDTVHPNSLGSALWTYCVYRAFQYRPSMKRASARSLLSRGVIYAKSDYTDFAGWTLSNCTISKDVSIYETRGGSAKLTGDGVNTHAFFSKVVIDSSDILAYRGRYVTVNFRLRVPSGNSIFCGRVSLYDGTTTTISANGGPQGNGFVSNAVSIKVGLAATSLTAYVYINQGTPSAEIVYVDRMTLSDGLLPQDALGMADPLVEGTTTPTSVFTTPGTIVTATTLDYSKIGNRVFWSAVVVTSGTAGAAAGELLIPLPFTSAVDACGAGEVHSLFKGCNARISAGDSVARASLYDGTTLAFSGLKIVVGGSYKV